MIRPTDHESSERFGRIKSEPGTIDLCSKAVTIVEKTMSWKALLMAKEAVRSSEITMVDEAVLDDLRARMRNEQCESVLKSLKTEVVEEQSTTPPMEEDSERSGVENIPRDEAPSPTKKHPQNEEKFNLARSVCHPIFMESFENGEIDKETYKKGMKKVVNKGYHRNWGKQRLEYYSQRYVRNHMIRRQNS